VPFELPQTPATGAPVRVAVQDTGEPFTTGQVQVVDPPAAGKAGVIGVGLPIEQYFPEKAESA
jgi:hypothetical protein